MSLQLPAITSSSASEAGPRDANDGHPRRNITILDGGSRDEGCCGDNTGPPRCDGAVAVSTGSRYPQHRLQDRNTLGRHKVWYVVLLSALLWRGREMWWGSPPLAHWHSRQLVRPLQASPHSRYRYAAAILCFLAGTCNSWHKP